MNLIIENENEIDYKIFSVSFCNNIKHAEWNLYFTGAQGIDGPMGKDGIIGPYGPSGLKGRLEKSNLINLDKIIQ